jgi:hypothetical protein
MTDDANKQLATEERFAHAVDQLLGMAAATAAFVACLPGASQVDIEAATRLAKSIAGTKVSTTSGAATPAMRADGMLEQMGLLAKRHQQKGAPKNNES